MPLKSTAQFLKVRLHPAQTRFRTSKATYRGFVGGRGSGKSYVGALDMLLRAGAAPGTYLAASPTYTMLKDASLKTFLDLGKQLQLLKDFRRGDMFATLVNGATVLFRSTDEPERLRGPNLSGVWLDEASQMHPDAYSIAIACLREGGRQGWMSCTFTPRGRQHWTYERFAAAGPDTELISCRTADNIFLPDGFVETVAGKYTLTQQRQELLGEFVDVEGALFRRDWFAVVAAAPLTRLRKCRAWDFAASAPKPGSDPDYTAGVLMSRTEEGVFYIEDVRRVREGPAAVERLVGQTAAIDGKEVRVELEQEPGSSGVALAARYIKILAGYPVYATRPTGDKHTRAVPLAAQAEAGNVKLVRGPWNGAFLDEVESFPVGRHDDQVDAAALAFAALTQSKGPFWMVVDGEVLRFGETPGKPKPKPAVEVTTEVDAGMGRSTVVKLNAHKGIPCGPGDPGWYPARRRWWGW
jgi:predicted phage terminase large subunit-like protein